MYPIIFVLIILICFAFLIPHWQLTRRHHKVELAFAPLEEALRERLDLIVDLLEESPDENAEALIELCETARVEETDAMMKAYTKIEKMLALPEPVAEPLLENEKELLELGAKYNKEIAPLNAMLERFPWKAYARALMIRKGKSFPSEN